MPKESKTPLTSADPSIFADAEEDDVRIPSGDAALRLQSDPRLSSAAFLLASASLPSFNMSLDAKNAALPVPSEWLQNKISSSAFLPQRSSSLEVLKYLGLLPEISGPSTEAILRQLTSVAPPPQPRVVVPQAQPECKPSVLNKDQNEPKEFTEDEIKEWDVLCGRGGKSNHHSGNKRYRQVVSEMKNKYRGTSAKTDKTALSRAIVDYVNGYGGRFLKKSKGGKWILLTKAEARKKTSQALRETKELKWTL